MTDEAPVTERATTADGAGSGATDPRRRRKRPAIGEFAVVFLLAIVLAVLIKTFLVQAFYIPSGSMVPTLQTGDRVLVNRLAYRLHPPRRGDVIVFEDPHPAPTHRGPIVTAFDWLTRGLGFGDGGTKDFIKRVIGLPGDLVEIQHGTVFVNGAPLKEPYIAREPDDGNYGPFTVPPGQLFVLGDNRAHSFDSRFPVSQGGLGYIPIDRVVGRAFAIVWPPTRWRWVHAATYGAA